MKKEYVYPQTIDVKLMSDESLLQGYQPTGGSVDGSPTEGEGGGSGFSGGAPARKLYI